MRKINEKRLRFIHDFQRMEFDRSRMENRIKGMEQRNVRYVVREQTRRNPGNH